MSPKKQGHFSRSVPQRVEKVFFDTLETVEKATKPSEPHSSAYRGTVELQKYSFMKNAVL